MNKKIIELIVKLDDIEIDGAGVDAMALVENPAIELDFLAFNQDNTWYVDNTGMEEFKKFLDDNKELMKKPGGGPAGDGGVDHGAQMQLLKENGISTEYPFGYCFQIAQFMFYALGGYDGPYDLMCIKGMDYKVAGHDFQSTHWYVQSKEDGRIIDLSAEQFEGILDIEEYYSEGRRANLGFPYYNVDGEKVMFDNTVPSLMTLKLYNKWKEKYGELEGIEEFYEACKYEETRMSMQFSEVDLPYVEEQFVYPSAGESRDDFMGRCIPVVIGEGYADDQAIAICYSYWEDDKFDVNVQAAPYVDQCGDDCKDKFASTEKFTDQQKAIYECLAQETVGTQYDPHTAIFVNIKEGQFNTLTDTLNAISALDILGDITNPAGQSKEVYRYAGALPQRGFCRAMMALNKVYTRDEIELLNGVNRQFGHNGSAYSVFEYKGGPRCRHFWEKLTMFNENGRIVFVSQGPANGRAGTVPNDMSNNGYWSAETKKKSEQAYAIRKSMGFSVQEEERIVVGPAMVPNKMIPRKDERGNPYYVYFTPETIKEISKKVFEQNKHNMTNTEHASDKTHTNNTLLESWIVKDPEMDQAKALGFDVPTGTWMVSYKINDDKMWQDIKAGKLKGFSVEGYFIEKAEAVRAAEETYNYVMSILKDVK